MALKKFGWSKMAPPVIVWDRDEPRQDAPPVSSFISR